MQTLAKKSKWRFYWYLFYASSGKSKNWGLILSNGCNSSFVSVSISSSFMSIFYLEFGLRKLVFAKCTRIINLFNVQEKWVWSRIELAKFLHNRWPRRLEADWDSAILIPFWGHSTITPDNKGLLTPNKNKTINGKLFGNAKNKICCDKIKEAFDKRG